MKSKYNSKNMDSGHLVRSLSSPSRRELLRTVGSLAPLPLVGCSSDPAQSRSPRTTAPAPDENGDQSGAPSSTTRTPTSTATVTASPTEGDSRPTVEIPRGRIDPAAFEPGGDPTVSLNDLTHSSGDPDRDGGIWLRWDDTAFSFGAVVADDDFVTSPGAGPEVFRNDSFQIGLARPLDDTPTYTEFLVGRSTADDGTPYPLGSTFAITHRGTEFVEEVPEDVPVRVTASDDRVRYLFAVGWDRLGFDGPPDPGSTYRFALVFLDRDSDRFANVAYFGGSRSHSPFGGKDEPERFGFATFVD